MAFFGTIIEDIADKLNRNDLSTQIGKAINKALRYYSKQRFWFNVDNVTLTLLSGSDELDLSALTDFGQETDMDGFVLYFNKRTYPLKKVKKLEYDFVNLESRGIPSIYAWVDDAYKIYPLADRDYTLYVNYFKDYPDLVAYGDTNDFTVYAEDLITDRALSDLWISTEHEPEMAQYHKQKEQDEYAKLLDFTRQKTASGELHAEEEMSSGY